VRDVWQERSKVSRETRAKLSQQVAGLRQRLDDLDEAFVFRKSIDKQTYDRQRDVTRERITLAEVELAEATAEDMDVEGILAFAQRVLADAARLREQADAEQKGRLQAALFPEGLRYEASGFGTAATSMAFMQIPAFDGANSGMASPAGVEPASPP
jgi:hypothetical protein